MNQLCLHAHPRELQREIMRFVQVIRERSACELSTGPRTEARYLRSWPIAVSLKPDGSGPVFGAALHNGSTGGLAFLSRRLMEPGTLIGVQLFWFARNPVWVPALVRHCTVVTHGHLVGCRFVLDEADEAMDEFEPVPVRRER